VRFAIMARPLGINACHCTDCKKLTGATHLLMILTTAEAFVHQRGDVVRWRKRADSGREIDIVRCVDCGVRLWHEPLANPEYVFVAAGCLDEPSWAEPTSHIWMSRLSPGVLVQDDAFQCEGQPATRQLLFDAFTRLHSK
jgi:hypothetical protein